MTRWPWLLLWAVEAAGLILVGVGLTFLALLAMGADLPSLPRVC